MSLKEQISTDMKVAMKAKESDKVQTLRMVLADLKKREIDGGKPLDDAAILKSIQTAIKQRRDSVESFEKGGRSDLADKEKSEIVFLQAYLPKQLSREELEALIETVISETGASSAKDMGKVMKGVMEKASGQAEGKLINEIARSKLS